MVSVNSNSPSSNGTIERDDRSNVHNNSTRVEDAWLSPVCVTPSHHNHIHHTSHSTNGLLLEFIIKIDIPC